MRNTSGLTRAGGRRSVRWRAVGAAFTCVLFVTGAWAGDHEIVLHSFGNGSDGSGPMAGLIVDGAGNFYGTTEYGGIHFTCPGGGGCGAVFELSPREGGGWTETVLHSFGGGNDGFSPVAALVMDRAGNLYGTTFSGGIHNNCEDGCGTVFELSPREGGGWTETLLHSFGGGTDGYYPAGVLILDGGGNLYGTTGNGGIHGLGTVFELSPREGGGWTETVLHSFKSDGSEGFSPNAGLVLDGAGDLYGTTYNGGIHGFGTVFELSPREGGGWTDTVLHSFGRGNDGYYPFAGLVKDGAGNLYGTTEYGGIHNNCDGGCGTVFELSPREGGGWTETVLHSFGRGTDGSVPVAGLIFDGAGNLYGTTQGGGIHGRGTAFELSPREGGGWTERVLFSIGFGDGLYGDLPSCGLVLDGVGNLYGTTQGGGTYQGGTVFELSPEEDGSWTGKSSPPWHKD
jgi:uncharacterized repeat protein (TIGR03803 family)